VTVFENASGNFENHESIFEDQCRTCTRGGWTFENQRRIFKRGSWICEDGTSIFQNGSWICENRGSIFEEGTSSFEDGPPIFTNPSGKSALAAREWRFPFIGRFADAVGVGVGGLAGVEGVEDVGRGMHADKALAAVDRIERRVPFYSGKG
jgi:hypothetical protein